MIPFMKIGLKTAGLALIPSSLVFLIATWATITDSWHWLQVYHAFGATYADLRQVTATADCILSDASWSIASATCDPFGRGYNYPSLWARGFAVLGLGEAQTEAVAVAMVIVFALVVFVVSLLSTYLVRPFVPIVSVTTAAVAPPTWLALERGNIDVFVFAAVVAGALLSLLHKSGLSAILFAIASVLKIYPLGAVLVLLRDRRRHPWSVGIFLALTTVGFALIVRELLLISERTPQPIASAFGAPVLLKTGWLRMDLPAGSLIPQLLGALIFVGVLLLLMGLAARIKGISESVATAVQAISRDRISTTLVLSGGGPLILSYILSANFDYRLIFAIPLVAGLARVAVQEINVIRVLLLALVIQLWLTYVTPILVQRLSDLLWMVLAPCVAFLLVRIMGTNLRAEAKSAG